jgi:hypothetical protein
MIKKTNPENKYVPQRIKKLVKQEANFNKDGNGEYDPSSLICRHKITFDLQKELYI